MSRLGEQPLISLQPRLQCKQHSSIRSITVCCASYNFLLWYYCLIMQQAGLYSLK